MTNNLRDKIIGNLRTLQIGFWLINLFLQWVLYFQPWTTRDNAGINIFYFSTYTISLFAVFYLHYYLIAPKYSSWKNNSTKVFLFILSLFAGIILVTLIKDFSRGFITNQFELLNKDHIYQAYHSATWVLIASSGFYFLYRWKTNISNITELNREIEDSKLQFHRAQMNPHFLFNVLNNLYAVALTTPSKAETLIEQLQELMEYSFKQSESDYVKLSDEIQFINNYITLQQTRLGTDSTLHYTFPSIDVCKLFYIQPLILIAFIENIFKHAEINNDDTPVTITISLDSQKIIYHSTNTISTASQLSTSGIGLNNVKSRLALRYPKTSSVIIEHTETTYTTDVIIPLETSVPESGVELHV